MTGTNGCPLFARPASPHPLPGALGHLTLSTPMAHPLSLNSRGGPRPPGDYALPTGYTAKLHDGKPQTFPEFALDCARAFGALILMRDDPPDAEIPDRFERSTHYAEWEAEAKARYAELQAMTTAQAELAAAEAHAEALSAWREMTDRDAAAIARYQAMVTEVEAWTPPTAEHEKLKTFMLNQLTESIRFDGTNLPEPQPLTGADWLQEEKDQAYKRIGRYAEDQAKEVARSEQRSAWVRALRSSLPVEVGA